ncbi:MAG: hypothetical protein QG594_1310 [Bacteroidota bacterium]|nr:hypothetical protein [Bacteroidota bacterium]
MFINTLKEISKAIIASKTIADELQAVDLLTVFFDQNINTKDFFDSKNEQLTKGGYALSSFHASICVDDALRTSKFIKSTYKAIQELQKKFTNQPISILYAGCGPYATLLLPLLPLFKPNELDIILLDINKSSIDSVKKIMNSPDFSSYKIQTIQADATSYQKPKNWPLHLLLTETMFKALLAEPQVLITKNLAPQLETGGILIPEEIKISFGYAFFGNIPFLSSNESINVLFFDKLKCIDEIEKKQLFSITKDLDFVSKKNPENNHIKSTFFELPKNFSNHPDVCLFTEITVFDHFKLNTSESYITNPNCLLSLYTTQNANFIQFNYQYESIPNWTYQLKQVESE